MEEKVDARIVRSRLLLREALVALIAEKGYEHVTVRDITQRATLNRSTFYLHYRDKEDLLYQTAREVFLDLRSCFGQSEPLPPPHEASPSLVRMFEHIAQNADLYRVMLSETGFPRFQTHLEKVIRESFANLKQLMQQTEDVASGPPFDFFLNYISSANTGMIGWWLRNDMPYTPKYMGTQMTRLIGSTIQAHMVS